MLSTDVVFEPTPRSLSQTEARREATRRGVRIASLPTITEEIFARTMPVDCAELKRTSEWLAGRLTLASTARVTSGAGTDLTVQLNGRTWHGDDGNLQQGGAFGNLPAGEGYVAPLETVGEGIIVIDASLAGYGLLRRPSASRSRVAAPLRRTRTPGSGCSRRSTRGEHGRSLAELGLGTDGCGIANRRGVPLHVNR